MGILFRTFYIFLNVQYNWRKMSHIITKMSYVCICFVIFYCANKLILFFRENKIVLKSEKNFWNTCMHAYVDMYYWLLHPCVVYPFTGLIEWGISLKNKCRVSVLASWALQWNKYMMQVPCILNRIPSDWLRKFHTCSPVPLPYYCCLVAI